MSRSGELPTKRRSKGREEDATTTFVLTVIEGPDKGASFTLDARSPARVLVGQGAICDLRLTDPEVSRRHASIRALKRELELRDLGSMNGTTVNGVAIREVILRGGESVRLGTSVLSISRGAPSFAAPLAMTTFGRVRGTSRAMRALYPVLERLASSDVPVLLEGEPGTGKELVAGELHERGGHAEAPFVALATTDREPAAIEEELKALLEASPATLYVEEAAHLPLACQTVLLKSKGVRVVLGTRADLDRAVSEGRFLEELYARVASSRVELPPLRERDGDVAVLAAAFWKELAGEAAELPTDFLSRFEHYPWPGNVRELRQAIEARSLQGELARFVPERKPGTAGNDFLDAVVDQGLTFARAKQIVLDELQRRYVQGTLAQHDGSVSRAAAASGLARRYFQLIRARFR